MCVWRTVWRASKSAIILIDVPVVWITVRTIRRAYASVRGVLMHEMICLRFIWFVALFHLNFCLFSSFLLEYCDVSNVHVLFVFLFVMCDLIWPKIISRSKIVSVFEWCHRSTTTQIMAFVKNSTAHIYRQTSFPSHLQFVCECVRFRREKKSVALFW